jgi:small subunit ribosomal protein S1
MKATENKNSEIMQNLLAKEVFNIPKTGEVIEAQVIAIKPNVVYLDIKNFKTAMIMGSEIKKHPQEFKQIKPGDTIIVKIINLENEDGYTEASLLKAGEEKIWQALREKMQTNEIIEAVVLKANKGGLMIEIENTEAFMPVSQLAPNHYPRVEGGDKIKILVELNKLVGETIKVKIIDLDPGERKLIVSEKATEEKKLQEELKKYKVGDVIEGAITGIVDFGAFIKFDNLEGLIHISEMDWQIIDNPHDIFRVDDMVKAQIIDIEENRVSLSTRALKENPWDNLDKKYQVGQIVKGEVIKYNPFGAFVKLDEHIQGLAHISEFGTEKKMQEMLKLGQEYEFKILSIKPSEYRMALKPMHTAPCV